VEAAWIPEAHRSTLCLSVQVGCKMGCLFCMTGKQGFQGQLSAGEILNQYQQPSRARPGHQHRLHGHGGTAGQPGSVMDSLEVLSADYGFGLSPTRITVSNRGAPAGPAYIPGGQHMPSCHSACTLLSRRSVVG